MANRLKSPSKLTLAFITTVAIGMGTAASASASEYSTETVDTFDVSVADLQRANVTAADGDRSGGPNDVNYGERDFPVSREVVARSALGEHPGLASSSIELSAPIPVNDANGQTSYFAFNYESPEYGDGYILVAAHTRVPLIGKIVANRHLNPDLDSIKLGGSGVVQVANYSSSTPDSTISKRDAIDLQRAQAMTLRHSDAVDINTIELETKIQLNNIALLSATDPSEEHFGYKFTGQTEEGYARITDPVAYLNNRYGGTWTRADSKYLSMPGFTMLKIKEDAKMYGDTNHCVLTAVTRVFAHARGKGFSKITTNDPSIYLTTRSVARKHGWTTSSGTNPTKINNIIMEVGDAYKYPATDSKGVYIYSFADTIKSEVDANRPLLWNIASGFYEKHTVTVRGYAVYKRADGKTARLVSVLDGWSPSASFVDFEAFAASRSFASLNTVNVR